MGLAGIPSKVMRHGFLGSARIVSRRLKHQMSAPAAHIRRVARLRNNDFIVTFTCEGGRAIKLPRVSELDFFSRDKRMLALNMAFFIDRPKKEALLRRFVYSMYQNGYIDDHKSIIDIGAWLGDNAIVWSTFLEGDAVVFAIDPAPQNIAFGKEVAALNGCPNINWVNAVCSDQSGIRLHYEGDLDHATFNSDGVGIDSGMLTTTLDEVIGLDLASIGMLHVDVEGFEMNVIRGAAGIIEASQPIVLFEQHISKDNVMEICGFFRSRGYEVYMINEVLPTGAPDCRNFLAAPKGIDVTRVLDIDMQNGRKDDTWYATLGGAVVAVP